jgi:hypothetical protein
MTTEIVPTETTQTMTLQEQWRFAEAVTGSRGSILPKAYREDPGAVLVAVNLGAAMGLSPAESLYRIHVVEGKPSASAELIAANVRRAGHRLRIKATNEAATVQIVRADDPEFVYEVTWTMADAKRAGLAGKQVWQAYPQSMLRSRAVTECARTACPEALYGVIYATEEVQDITTTEAPRRQSAADVLGTSETAAQATRPAEPAPNPDAPTTAQTRALWAALNDAGISEDRAQRLSWMSSHVGREIATSKDLTAAEVSQLIDTAKANAEFAAEVLDAARTEDEGADQ